MARRNRCGTVSKPLNLGGGAKLTFGGDWKFKNCFTTFSKT